MTRDDAPSPPPLILDDVGRLGAWGAAAAVGWSVLLNAALGLYRVMRGYLFYSSDDYNRMGYALHWAANPYFAPGDYLWLSGNFYVLGSLIRALDDPMYAVLAMGLLSWSAVGLALWFLARVLSLPTLGMLLGIVWISVNRLAQPVAMSSLPDWLSWAAAIGAMAALTGAWRRPEHGLAMLWTGSACAAAATTLRYEAWILAGFMGPVQLAWLWVHGRRNPRALAIGIPAMALPFVFPAMWMGSAWRTLGDPLAFARPDHNPLYRHYEWSGVLGFQKGRDTTLSGRLRDGVYMTSFAWQLGWSLLPGLALFAALGRRGTRWLAVIPGLAWLAVVFAITFRSGISGNLPARVVLAALAALAPVSFAGLALLLARAWSRRTPAWIAGAAIACVAMFLATQKNNDGLAREHRIIDHKAVDTSSLLMGWRMRYEFNGSGEFLDAYRGETIVMWAPWDRAQNGDYYAIMALSGEPLRFHGLWQDDLPLEHLANSNTRIFLECFLPPGLVEENGFRLVTAEGIWRLWARRDMFTKYADLNIEALGTAEEPILFQPHSSLEWAMHASPTEMTFAEAADYAAASRYAGHDDWRIPAEKELWKISAYSLRNDPAIDHRFAPRHRTIWSATPGLRPRTRMTIDFSALLPVTFSEDLRAGAVLVRDP